MLETANIFMTGGAGTLGKAIARKRKEEGWAGHLTVYSTDAGKHAEMRKLYPDVTYVQGDICSPNTLRLAMAGHDVVIHAAAVKFIPDSEYASMDTIAINVFGSQNVCEAALAVGVSSVLGISTDKACHPANTYGSSKHLMEKIFQEYARAGTDTEFHLVRYGNVLESRGSVIESWKRAVEAGKPVRVTDTSMTRFWLSPAQAAMYVVESFKYATGHIFIPRMPSLSIGKLLEYTLGKDQQVEFIPMRPGEKLHETLLTFEETEFAEYEPADGEGGFYVLHPTTDPRFETDDPPMEYTSENARELTKQELDDLLMDK